MCPGHRANMKNVTCPACGKSQSASFPACIYCCEHDILTFYEDWKSDDDTGYWGVDVKCKNCGKNFDFDPDVLIREYWAVRKPIRTDN